MDYSLEWNTDYFEPVVILGTVVFSLIGYWITIHSSYLKEAFIRRYGEEKTKIKWVFFWRYAGMFYFLCIPLIISLFIIRRNLGDLGININDVSGSVIWILGMGISIILIQSIVSGNKTNLAQYPQVRIKEWSVLLFLKNSLLWFLYLCSYEFMFRGFLLFGSVYAFGVWPGILLNAALYSLAHIPKGAKEAVLAIPFGIFICYITLRTETIWAAVFIHLILALSNDFFSIRANPEMMFKKRAA